MKQFLISLLFPLAGAAILVLTTFNLIPTEYLIPVLIVACIITGFGIIIAALNSIINMDLLNSSIYITIATICLLVITSQVKDALIYLVIIQFVQVIFISLTAHRYHNANDSFALKMITFIFIIGSMVIAVYYKSIPIILICTAFLPHRNLSGFYFNSIKNNKRFFNSRIAVFSKNAIIDTKNYILKTVYPIDRSTSEEELLKYAAQAEAPYAGTHIADCIIKAYKDTVALSNVTNTEKANGLGIKTATKEGTILIGNRQYLESQDISDIPGFSAMNDLTVTDTILHVTYNGTYLGFLHLTTTVFKDVEAFLRLLRRHHVRPVLISGEDFNVDSCMSLGFKYVYTNQSAVSMQENLHLLKKKFKKSSIIYIDTRLNDATISNMADFTIRISSNRNIDDADLVFLPGDYVTAKKALRRLYRSRANTWLYVLLIFVIKALLCAGTFFIPGFLAWHALCVDAVIFIITAVFLSLRKN